MQTRPSQKFKYGVKWLFAGCPPRWTVHPNQNSVNGVRNDADRTPETCQAYCVLVPTCVAVDFDYSDNSCWLHINATDLSDDTTHWQRDTTQYRIDRTCTTEMPGSSVVRFFPEKFKTNIVFLIS